MFSKIPVYMWTRPQISHLLWTYSLLKSHGPSTNYSKNLDLLLFFFSFLGNYTWRLAVRPLLPVFMLSKLVSWV